MEIHELRLLPVDAASIHFAPAGHDRRTSPRHGDLDDMAPALQHRTTDELGKAGGLQQLSLPLVHACGHRVDARQKHTGNGTPGSPSRFLRAFR